MYSCKLTVISNSGSTSEAVSKDYNGVNQRYIGNIGTGSEQPMPPAGVALPASYTSFWEWADAVARGINSLTIDTFANSRIQAVFDINQEVG